MTRQDDGYFMKMALGLAERGQGLTSPNPLVGAVVVKNGKVVGKGWHRRYGEAHAEANAIDDAGAEADGATLYVTLEPCNHTGCTSPCTEKILSSGIRRVVVAMKDPNPGVTGGGNECLVEKGGILVESSVCEKEARKLNEAFINYVMTRRPFVTLKCAATLDGRIATGTGDSKWITNEESREYVHMLRNNADAIMVGIETVKSDDPRLTSRIEGKTTTDPVRIILDTHLDISPHAKVLNLDSNADTIIVTGVGAPGKKKTAVEKKGVRILEMPLSNGLIDLDRLMDTLGQLRMTSLLIEGGSRVTGSALRAGIVDKVIFCYAPKIMGGDDGVPIASGKGPETMEGCIQVRHIRTIRFRDDIMIEGYLKCLPGS